MPNLTELLQLYGVLIVFAIVLVEQGGLPIPAFPILIVSGALAMSGGISPLACVGVAVLACLIADLFWFHAGRFYGTRILRLLCKISLSPDSCVSQTEDKFARFGVKALIVSKFIPGFNIVAAPMSGALGVSKPRFLAFSGSGSVLWSSTGVALGALFHKSVDRVLTFLSAMGTTAVLGLAALLGIFVLYKYLERRRVRRAMAIARIGVPELLSLIAAGHEPLIIDARSATARQLEEAIPGAAFFDSCEADGMLVGVDKERHIVVYCSCPNDVTAAQVAKQFLAHGFHRARPLQGGLDAWKAHHNSAQ
ncbi:DedA family protein/thiosulfate sulfurtransferase GlpE [Massilia sp. PAMC28688]|uniref:DedA family protein/thiosulfate sulfurtransferase GlpE n=1 Tax=Massilia sp. PAMC28688 TaxID=2861283 RepID=UPI001C626CF4|nr:DedA family protein/thiosulfate sulfurtransferase GlpE [Massilia sp. PAMC28688]QYF94235.1 DedA family protein/thiosulfate sulfurtransferase GlpE [Massilia sp. PAMC28688]